MITITLDTGVINSMGKLPAMSKLEKWHDEERIQLYISDVMEKESTVGSSQWKKQNKYVFQLLRPDKMEYPPRFNKFKNILFPRVKELNDNQKMDVNHVCVHLKYGNDFFVTKDKNFIRNRKNLEENSIYVLTPDECVDFLTKKYGWQ